MSKILYESQQKYLRSLRRTPDGLLMEMEKFAAKKNIPILDWKAAELLELLVKINSPKRVLEIGTAIAYSSIRIARALKTGAVLDTIEKSKHNIPLAQNFINRTGLKSKINILEGEALKIIPLLKENYDFIFLDADKQDYEKLFLFSLMVLKKGGVIFVDNLLWHGYAAAKSVPAKDKRSTEIIRDFNKSFLSNSLIHAAIYPVGDGIGIGIKI